MRSSENVIRFKTGSCRKKRTLSNWDEDKLHALHQFRLCGLKNLSANHGRVNDSLAAQNTEQTLAEHIRKATRRRYEIISYHVNDRWVRTPMNDCDTPYDPTVYVPLHDIPPLVHQEHWQAECSQSRTSLPLTQLENVLERFSKPEKELDMAVNGGTGDSLDIRAAIKSGSNYPDHIEHGRLVERTRYKPDVSFSFTTRPRGTLNLLAEVVPKVEDPEQIHSIVPGAEFTARGAEKLPSVEDGENFVARAHWRPQPGELNAKGSTANTQANCDTITSKKIRKTTENHFNTITNKKIRKTTENITDCKSKTFKGRENFDIETERLLRVQRDARVDFERLQMWLEKTGAMTSL